MITNPEWSGKLEAAYKNLYGKEIELTTENAGYEWIKMFFENGAIYLSMFAKKDVFLTSLYGTFTLLVLVGSVKYLPFASRSGVNSMLQLSNEIEEAATIMGVRWWKRMTVYQNIAFGLENLKWDKKKVDKRVKELLEMLKIAELIKRYPSELSGGQQQRVAIARTLATGSKVLFMDEPLSNLDSKLRIEMRTELKRLHLETDSTFVYVTHDQLEAMTLSTQICLLKEGLLQQYKPPLEIYKNPVNTFVADFVGNPTMNIVEVQGKNVNIDEIKLKFAGMNLLFTPKTGSITLKDNHLVL